MMAKLFALPDEHLIKSLITRFPCRERQIRALTTLLSPASPSPKNIVLHGLTATGKSSIIAAVLESFVRSGDIGDDNGGEEKARRTYAIIKSAECITARHLLERSVGGVAKAIRWEGRVERCEDVGRLVEILGKMVGGLGQGKDGNGDGEEREEDRKFTLVFDGIDKQRDAQHTLLPALGRLSEVIPHLTTIFIVTSPRPHFLHTSNPIYISFPAYTKPEALSILSFAPPPLSSILLSSPSTPNTNIISPSRPSPTTEQLTNLWTRYLSALWDTFASHAARDIISFKHLATKLWPNFVAPVREGRFLATDFQRLFISQRALFRDESVLVSSIIHQPTTTAARNGPAMARSKAVTKTPLLPYTSQILLLAAYLCSYIPARLDVTIFSKVTTKKKRRGGAMASGTVKGGGARKGKNTLAQRRRIDRKLLGPQAFVLERLLAIFWVVWEEATHSREGKGYAGGGGEAPWRGRKGIREVGGSADVLAQIATLASLKLLVRTGREELDGGSKLRVNVGWEVVRSLGRGVGVELGEWLE